MTSRKVCIVGSGVGAYFTLGTLLQECSSGDLSITILTTGSTDESDSLYEKPAAKHVASNTATKMAGIIPEKLLFGSDRVYQNYPYLVLDDTSMPYKPKRTLHFGGLTHMWGANMSFLTENDMKVFPELSKLVYIEESVYQSFRVSGYETVGRVVDGVVMGNRGMTIANPQTQKIINRLESLKDKQGRFRIYSSNLAVETQKLSSRKCVFCAECMVGCSRRAIWSADLPLRQLIAGRSSISMLENARAIKLVLENDRWRIHFEKNGERKSEVFDNIFIGCGALDTVDLLAASNLLPNLTRLGDSKKYYTLNFSIRALSPDLEANMLSLSNLSYQFDSKSGTYHCQMYPSTEIIRQIVDRWPIPNFLKAYLSRHFVIGMVYLPSKLSGGASVEKQDSQADPIYKIQPENEGFRKKFMRWATNLHFFVTSSLKLSKLGFFTAPMFYSTPLFNSQHFGALKDQSNTLVVDRLNVNLTVVDGVSLDDIPGTPTTSLIASNAIFRTRKVLSTWI